jgi:hypothetical protein
LRCSKSPDGDRYDEPYTNNSYTLVRNHPLFVAAQQSKCPELIEHRYHTCLRNDKFFMFGAYVLGLFSILYIAYLSVFTALILQSKQPEYFYNKTNINYTDDLATCQSVSNAIVSQNITEGLKTDSYRSLRWAALGLLIVFIVKNAILIISLFPKLLRTGAYFLEISVLVLSFVYILDWYDWLNPVIFRCPVQYQIGSFALLLAWINLLPYVRCFPYTRIGIYVVMLQVILWKFLLFLPVLMIMVCGFGFTFWMLLQNQPVYGTPIEALIRTSFMLFELNYDDRLYKPDEGGISYYTVVYVVYICTGIVFAIFIVNLMISKYLFI